MISINRIYTLSIENLFSFQNTNEEDTTNELDSDDIILKLKGFFDKYANSVKNRVKLVDKIILPSDIDENEFSFLQIGEKNKQKSKQIMNDKVIYTEKFDMNDLQMKSKNAIDQLINIKERNLNSFREDKQKEEEKNIDFSTKKKIYSSRLNIANTEIGKNQKDLNEKNSVRNSYEHEIKSKAQLSESLLKENNKNMINLKDILLKFDFVVDNLNLDKNTFKEELKLDDLKAKLNRKIYKSIKESEFLAEQDTNKKGFIKDLMKLKSLFEENIKKIRSKNDDITSSIYNKTEIYKKIKEKIANRYESIENLNMTATKLKLMQYEYKNNLRQIDEEITILKSKKKIIEDNINFKKNQKVNSKKNIENVLSNLEKQMDKYKVEEISLNKYRKEITSINNNLRNILSKENMIFKKNKIKI